MNYRARLPLLVTVMLSFGSASHAQEKQLSPSENLFDDGVLAAAMLTVTEMPYAELKSFANFLARCGDDLDPNPNIQYQCNVSYAEFDIEFGKNGPLFNALQAWRLESALIRSNQAIHKSLGNDNAAFLRLMFLRHQLRETATFRFSELRSGDHHERR